MDKTKILEKKKQLEKKKELDEIIASDKFFKLVEKDKKEKELNSLMKECIKDWCEDTTSHGFSNMVKTDSWIIRITWIILIIVSMAYCMYTVCFIIMNYLSYSVVTSYQIVTESPTEFPAITICNLNPFDVTADSGTGTYINNILKNNDISPTINVTGLSDTYAITLVDEAASLLKAYVTADKTLNKTQLKTLGFSIDSLLVSCYYNKAKCNGSDFNWVRSNEFGNCYTFNDLISNGAEVSSKSTSKTGPEFGLNLEIFIGVSGKNDYYTVKNGVHLFVHNRGELPIFKNEGIDIQSGTATNIAISKTKYSKYDPPYSTCRRDVASILSTDSEVYKKTLGISKYRQKLCYEICLQKYYIIPYCGCADPTITATDSTQAICNNSTTLECVNTQRDYFDSLDIHDACDNYCPLECDSTSFSLSLSSASYPTDYYWDIIKYQSNIISKSVVQNTFTPSSGPNPGPQPVARRKRQAPGQALNDSSLTTVTTKSNPVNVQNTTASVSQQNQPGNSAPNNNMPSKADDTMKTSILKVSIYYDDLRYTFVEETPAIDFVTLIGVIGGQFGLFMGASFLSFAEVIEMLINLLRVMAKYKKLKNQIVQELNE